MSVPPRRVNEIVKGERAVTADIALRLARYFGTSAQFWINLQAHYDLARAENSIARTIKQEVRVFQLAT